MLGVEWYKRESMFQRDREFFRSGWEDPANETGGFLNLTAYSPGSVSVPVGGVGNALPPTVLAFERRLGDTRALVALNFGDTAHPLALGTGAVAAGLRTRPGAPLPARFDAVELAPNEGVVLLVG